MRVFILLVMLTLKATPQRLMREIIFIMRVNVRNNAEACFSLIMRETWYVWTY